MKNLSLLELEKTRLKFLAGRPVRSIARSLGRLSLDWLRPGDRYRRRAIDALTRRSGYSAQMAESMLKALFTELTEPKILGVLKSELGDPLVLDGFRRDRHAGVFRRAAGPGLIAHVFAGTSPGAAVWSFVFGMLMKASNVGKPSSRDEGLIRIYLESLDRRDRSLARTNRLLDARDRKGLAEVMRQSGLIVAYGDETTLDELQAQAPPRAPFVRYGHRASFSLYMKETLSLSRWKALARRTAADVWAMDQRGCLSPLAVYVERGGAVTPPLFARHVAHEIGRLPQPRRTRSRSAAHEIFRDRFKLRRLRGESALFWESRPRGSWAVYYDENPAFPPEARHQTVIVKAFDGLADVYGALWPFAGRLEAAALEAPGARRLAIARELARLGICRVCRAGTLQRPPLTWRHDGCYNIASWVKWTDLEV